MESLKRKTPRKEAPFISTNNYRPTEFETTSFIKFSEGVENEKLGTT
jgi:hypothetical protein